MGKLVVSLKQWEWGMNKSDVLESDLFEQVVTLSSSCGGGQSVAAKVVVFLRGNSVGVFWLSCSDCYFGKHIYGRFRLYSGLDRLLRFEPSREPYKQWKAMVNQVSDYLKEMEVKDG